MFINMLFKIRDSKKFNQEVTHQVCTFFPFCLAIFSVLFAYVFIGSIFSNSAFAQDVQKAQDHIPATAKQSKPNEVQALKSEDKDDTNSPKEISSSKQNPETEKNAGSNKSDAEQKKADTNKAGTEEKKDSVQQAETQKKQLELSSEYKDVYNVKKHDTLWDISDKALKSPYRWPALWGRNPHIRNPHWIYPGDTIYLHDRQTSGNINKPSSSPPIDTQVEPTQPVEINPPYYYFYPLMESVGYLKERAVDSVGKIISCMPRHQKEIDIDNGVYLYIKDESNLMVGDQFQILRTFYIRDKNSSTFPLVHHYIAGIVEITKLKAKPCKCHEQVSQVEGKIITAYRTIFSDDILVPYNSVDSKLLVRQSNENMEAKILFSEDHKKEIDENAVVFINKGRADGLQIGQFYDIFNQPKGELIDSDKYIEKTEFIGSLLILRLEERTSSALITFAYKDIAPGDIMVSPRPENAFTNITLKGNYR